MQLFQSFHGKDPKGIVDKQVSDTIRKVYVALGALEYLVVKPEGEKPQQIDFDGDGVTLASSPDGKSLYLVGGNQNITSALENFVDDPAKDFLDLGECLEVQYLARKVHSNYEPTSWFHKFGHELRPRLAFNRLQKTLYFVGGDYEIKAGADGVSPGIEG